jgi:GH15 family glucan-1,4-alpha-glucosidase
MPMPASLDPFETMRQTEQWWRDWSDRCTYQGPWREAVLRSLITLKALTYAPTGGIVAAPTTSLPEQLGGVRNWDYRFCWVRDASFTLYALLSSGYTAEAKEWRDWLLRAVAGKPSQLNIMYGLGGERRLPELTLLPGYENSAPVRIGNAAHGQFQLDVFGEVMAALNLARRHGVEPDENAWNVERALLDYLESAWQEPDEGIWEVRGPRRHFVHSKVMAWVAFDRMIKAVERNEQEGPVDRWRGFRDSIHAEICAKGFDPAQKTFVQYYGADMIDASLLMIPLTGFLPANDSRVLGTIAAIERDLVQDGLVARYPNRKEVDGLPPGEGTFLACSFWLADCYAQLGRRPEAQKLFERLLDLRNDVGLLAEEYDTRANRLVGNFPQAFSHIGLINTARNLLNEPRTQ